MSGYADPAHVHQENLRHQQHEKIPRVMCEPSGEHGNMHTKQKTFPATKHESLWRQRVHVSAPDHEGPGGPLAGLLPVEERGLKPSHAVGRWELVRAPRPTQKLVFLEAPGLARDLHNVVEHHPKGGYGHEIVGEAFLLQHRLGELAHEPKGVERRDGFCRGERHRRLLRGTLEVGLAVRKLRYTVHNQELRPHGLRQVFEGVLAQISQQILLSDNLGDVVRFFKILQTLTKHHTRYHPRGVVLAHNHNDHLPDPGRLAQDPFHLLRRHTHTTNVQLPVLAPLNLHDARNSQLQPTPNVARTIQEASSERIGHKLLGVANLADVALRQVVASNANLTSLTCGNGCQLVTQEMHLDARLRVPAGTHLLQVVTGFECPLKARGFRARVLIVDAHPERRYGLHADGGG
mmetsp:Transcript_43708/g.115466  ORF Transcript_43708/g.115466 Transcript_43708/m.115466 type:complete len:405 (-) Transcript_43708:1317-2531(-)